MNWGSVYRTMQILEATRVELEQHGFDRVTVRAIAKRAQVSPGLVLHHYGTKTGVVRASYDQLVSRVGQWVMRLGPARYAKLFGRFVRVLLSELRPIESALSAVLALPRTQGQGSIRETLELLTRRATNAGAVLVRDASGRTCVDAGALLLAELAVDRVLRLWIELGDADCAEAAGVRAAALLDEAVAHGVDLRVLARLDESLSVPTAQDRGRTIAVPRVVAPRLRARSTRNACEFSGPGTATGDAVSGTAGLASVLLMAGPRPNQR